MSSRLPSSDKDSLRKQSDQGGGGCCGGSKKKENYSDSLAVSKDQHDSSRGNRPSQKVDLSRGAKVVFLGEAGVGKSSIVGRYVKNQFDEHQPPTVGAAFLSRQHDLKHPKPRTIRFDLWDTAGFQSLAPLYYRGSLVAIIAYDITDRKSFERARAWLKELQVGCPSVLVIVITGCKLDLEEKRTVTTEEAQALAVENHCEFIECSAKQGKNVTEIFDMVGKLLLARTGEED